MEYKEIMNIILKHIDDGIVILDKDLNIINFNESAIEIIGYDNEKVMGKNLYDVFPILNNNKFGQSIISRKPIYDFMQNFTNYKGRDKVVLTTTIPLLKEKDFDGVLLIFKDYSHVKELAEKMLILQGTLYGEKTVDNKFLPNGTQYGINDIVSKSKIMEKLKEKILKLSDSIEPVFVYGETGTGKELVVESIHNSSTRRERPYITQKCCVMPDKLLENVLFGTYRGSFIGAKDKPGLLEITDGGTLFLDDIDNMGLELQRELLEVINTGKIRRIGSKISKDVDIRVIASSNIDPDKLVEDGKLDKELCEILTSTYIEVPALRNRKEDIELLVEHFIEESNNILNKNVKNIEKDVLEYLISKSWPGNVGELKNTIEISMNIIEGEYISLDDIRIDFGKEDEKVLSYDIELDDIDLKEAVEEYEKHIIRYALTKSNNNCAEAARKLKVPKQTLHGKIKRYDL